ncbi:MAG TPA: protein kinase [Polyangiaceae bacterium]|nr:protein kinase [Polyangiaceae bacterium]
MPGATPCVDDEALFAFARGELAGAELAQVEAHLRGCSDCRAVLAEAARSLEPSLPGSPGADEGGPTRIARYQIVSLLGAGASGVVYRAFDPQLKRAVALKLLRPEVHHGSHEQSARMLREAQAMARLSHPHVVAVYDVGLHEGTVYLVMEYIDGHTLRDWLREKPRELSEILAVFADAARGLAAAHAKGLVHRDFKPENVLVAEDGRARVTDFGLARESDSWLLERQMDDQASTELYAPTRGLVGTPAYMAPELFEGGVASPASDQFAFCVALFVALFDKHPFKAGEGIALSELITRVRGGTLQHPAFTHPRHERLFGVLQRGLAATTAARFPGIPQLLLALDGAVGRRRSGLFLMASALSALVVALASARFFGGASAPATAPPLVNAGALPPPSAAAGPQAAPSPVAEIAGRPVIVPEPAPSASVTAPAARAPATVPSGKRRAPKPTDVRYKDWLKDPF